MGPLSLHTQITVVPGRDACHALGFRIPKIDWFDHPTLAPSLVNIGLASLFMAVGYLVSKSKGLVWDHQQEINISIPGFQNSATWNQLPPLLLETHLRRWIFEDTFWFQLENQKAVAP